MNELKRGEEAFKLHQKIADNEQKRRELMIENILCLEKMREEKLYKYYLGDENGKWAGYLGQIEVFYTRAKVQRWIYILNRLAKPFNVPLIQLLSVPESRLEEVARYATQENYQELLQYASSLTSLDWKIELGKIKGFDFENCEHLESDVVKICRNCGVKHKQNG